MYDELLGHYKPLKDIHYGLNGNVIHIKQYAVLASVFQNDFLEMTLTNFK